jgi:hypothetical protein
MLDLEELLKSNQADKEASTTVKSSKAALARIKMLATDNILGTRLQDLPQDVLIMILSLLDNLDDLTSCSRTCFALWHASKQARLYLNVIRSDWLFLSPKKLHRHVNKASESLTIEYRPKEMVGFPRKLKTFLEENTAMRSVTLKGGIVDMNWLEMRRMPKGLKQLSIKGATLLDNTKKLWCRPSYQQWETNLWKIKPRKQLSLFKLERLEFSNCSNINFGDLTRSLLASRRGIEAIGWWQFYEWLLPKICCEFVLRRDLQDKVLLSLEEIRDLAGCYGDARAAVHVGLLAEAREEIISTVGRRLDGLEEQIRGLTWEAKEDRVCITLTI